MLRRLGDIATWREWRGWGHDPNTFLIRADGFGRSGQSTTGIDDLERRSPDLNAAMPLGSPRSDLGPLRHHPRLEDDLGQLRPDPGAG